MLHVVTDDAVLADGGFLDGACAVLAGGGSALALHVRGPHSSGAVVHALVRALLPAARAAGARLLVNDRIDVALVSGADGVQLGRRSLPAPSARAILGPGRLLGASVHDAREAAAARAGGVDFAVVGTVYDTPSHPEGRVRGPEVIAEAARAAPGIPLLAIGGVTPERVDEVLGWGAHGTAVLGGVWRADDPAAAVGRYLQALEAGRREPAER